MALWFLIMGCSLFAGGALAAAGHNVSAFLCWLVCVLCAWMLARRFSEEM